MWSSAASPLPSTLRTLETQNPDVAHTCVGHLTQLWSIGNHWVTLLLGSVSISILKILNVSSISVKLSIVSTLLIVSIKCTYHSKLMSGIQNSEALYIPRDCRHPHHLVLEHFHLLSSKFHTHPPLSTPILCHSCFSCRLTAYNVLFNLLRFASYGAYLTVRVLEYKVFGVWLLSLGLILPRFIDIGILLCAKDTSSDALNC